MQTKKVGQGMVALGCIVGLGLLTVFFSDVEQRQHNPNQDPQSNKTARAAEVNLVRNRQGHYILTGNINRKQVEFLLDTGATDVVIPQAMARELNLKAGRRAQAMTANGPVTVFNTSIDELSIGDITLYNVRASLNPSMRPPSILLGMSALKQVEMIQRGDSLTLRQIF
ncbi:MAG: TIGR02281 family clan AA aspartic protease [bacterium]|nr:TIGR02281 family clan AA aspartic protease [Gammaproteobacteria bacterium]HIL95562.1 TIGR02281 family clan AA aspartic protease [Pseudomonadales bacterium]